jgi:hypothetical protein
VFALFNVSRDLHPADQSRHAMLLLLLVLVSGWCWCWCWCWLTLV